MKLLKTKALLFLVLLSAGCQEEEANPNYPIEPSITLESVDFIKSEDNPFDSLIITIGYRDGDSDLRSSQNQNPQNQYTLLPDPDTGEKYWMFNKKDPALPPFNCRDYTLIEAYDNSNYPDTVRAIYNDDYYNFNVTVWRKQGESYEAIDFISNCRTPLGGIFLMEEQPNTGSPFAVYPINQWEGRIVYSINGNLRSYFRNDSAKVSVSIRDEALHRSNTVISEPFLFR